MLRDVVTRDNTASDVWADTAYRSQANEAWLKSMDRVSRVHRKKPRGKPMSRRASGANAKRSSVRARVGHVFARQKDQMGLFVRTIGIARAEAKITLANLVNNIDRLIFHERQAVTGELRAAKVLSGWVSQKHRIRTATTEQDAVLRPNQRRAVMLMWVPIFWL